MTKKKKDVESTEAVETTNEKQLLTYEEAEQILENGGAIALDGWVGFWKKETSLNKILVVTKDNEVFDSPDDQYKDVPEWIEVYPTQDQINAIEKYLIDLNAKKTKEKLAVKIVAYRPDYGVNPILLEKPASIGKLLVNLPADIKKNYQLISEDGRVFDLLKNAFTNEKIKI